MIVDDLTPLAVPVDRLDSLPGNPRRGDVAAVARSYAEFGQRKPIVARRQDDGRGVVIAGNHQLAAARELGWDEIAVVWVDDDDLRAKAFALADNRTADLGEYDEDALAAMLAEVAVDEALLEAASFSMEDVTPPHPVEKLTDPDDAPAAPESPVTKPGDLWLLGEHRLVCGDSSDVDVLDRLVGDGEVDCVWTDPPYGVAYVGKTADALTIENDRLDEQGLEDLLRGSLGAAWAKCRPGAAWYVAAPGGPLFHVFGTVLGELGVWRQTIIWVKDAFVLGRSDYHWRHEPLFYGWRGDAAHWFVDDRTLDTVWEVPRPKRSSDHPTMKPVELIGRALRNSTRPGEIVLDPFGGSGSTLIAAHGEGRRARLAELDPRYCDVICRRWQEHTGQAPLHGDLGEQIDFAA